MKFHLRELSLRAANRACTHTVARRLRRRPTSKSANQPAYGEFRASRIPTRRHRRNENTWREGKRQNTPRPPTRTRGLALTYSLALSCVHTHTHTHRERARVQDSYGATNDWNDLHSMSNRRSLSVFLRSPSSFPSRAPERLSLPPSIRSTFVVSVGLARVTFSEGGAGLI